MLANTKLLGWKWLTLTNSLAYYDTAKINDVKSFVAQGASFNLIINLTTAMSGRLGHLPDPEY